MSVYNALPTLVAAAIIVLGARFALNRRYPHNISTLVFWGLMFLPGLAACLITGWMFFWDIPRVFAWLLNLPVLALMAIPVITSLTIGKRQRSHH